MTKTTSIKTAKEAVAAIQSGQHVFVGSGAAEPQHLIEALANRGAELSDTEILHLLTLGIAPYAQAHFEGHIRHNALFIGPNVRDAVAKGLADYSPCFLSEIPSLFRTGRVPIDVAMIEVAPGPKKGIFSLGVSVDIVQAATQSAHRVIAQVNTRMPYTLGESLITQDQIDDLVYFDEKLPELPAEDLGPAALWIGRYVANLIKDGSTLQMGIGSIPDAVLSSLGNKKNLGVHSEMISDGVLHLLNQGVINGRKKSINPGVIVTSFCLGSERLYQALHRNKKFEFRPSDYTNDPWVIAQNDHMVSINSALAVDLTGQVGADSLGNRFYSGVGGQVDFIRGAARSNGGRSIIALPSTAKGGLVSRICPYLSAGTGVVTTRADIDYVVTEYGVASLKGRTIRERAIALIQIAHPDHRKNLIQEAQKLGYLDQGHLLAENATAYRADLEARVEINGLHIFLRPLKPTDERILKDLFYSQSPQTTYWRFGAALKRLGSRQFQELVAIDYQNSMAIGIFIREKSRVRLIGVARYHNKTGDPLAEAAFTVHDRYQGRGLGTLLVDYLSWIAQQEGLKGFKAEMLKENFRMRHIFGKCFSGVQAEHNADQSSLVLSFDQWKKQENPLRSLKQS